MDAPPRPRKSVAPFAIAALVIFVIGALIVLGYRSRARSSQPAAPARTGMNADAGA